MNPRTMLAKYLNTSYAFRELNHEEDIRKDGMNLTTLQGDLTFWDRLAPWYERWLIRGSYHQAIIKEVTQIIEHGWKVLDIGAGTGVLSLPMAALGCSVEAVEPSAGMRRIFSEKIAMFEGIRIDISPERWESYSERRGNPPDLVLACNSLHLTQGGIMQGMEKIFAQGAGNVCLVTEINQGMRIDFKDIQGSQHGYNFLFIKNLSVDSSFFFEDADEVRELSMLLNRELPVVREEGLLAHRDSTDIAVVMWEKD